MFWTAIVCTQDKRQKNLIVTIPLQVKVQEGIISSDSPCKNRNTFFLDMYYSIILTICIYLLCFTNRKSRQEYGQRIKRPLIRGHGQTSFDDSDTRWAGLFTARKSLSSDSHSQEPSLYKVLGHFPGNVQLLPQRL